MPPGLFKLIAHYRRLWFFNFRRFEGGNYRRMEKYFAEILITELERFMPLENKAVLDVGGADGVFCQVLHQLRGCDATNLDPDPKDCTWPQTVVGRAQNIPFEDEHFDVVICRGVLEHIPPDEQATSVDEIHRVLKPDGIAYILIPPWFNPHAGHEVKPFHLLPFPVARWLSDVVFGRNIRANSYAEIKLFPITFSQMRRLAADSGFLELGTLDTHFRLHILTRIPLLREIAVPAVAFLLARK